MKEMNAEGLYLNIKTVAVIIVSIIGFTFGVVSFAAPFIQAKNDCQKLENRVERIENKMDQLILQLSRIKIVSASGFSLNEEIYKN